MFNISVIVPTYNCGEFIYEAITSILNQTHQASEILVVDDGSTDNTKEIVLSINSPVVRYIRQENSGVSSARNLGLANALGDYITFLDADDLWHLEMLESQIRVLENHNDVMLCFTNFTRFIHKTNEILPEQFLYYPELQSVQSTRIPNTPAHIVDENAFCACVKFGEIPAYTQVIMFRKSAVSGFLFNPHLTICEDLEFFLRVCSKGKIAFNPTVLAYVRRHDTNATKDISLIPKYKLEALLSVKATTQLSTEMLTALDTRIVKSYIDYGISLATAGRRHHAWKYFIKSFSVKSNYFRKLKGFLNLLLKSTRSKKS